jgi:hypothetical protein
LKPRELLENIARINVLKYMKNRIKHFIVDLEEIKDKESYNSEAFVLADRVIMDLQSLLNKIDY